MGDTGHKWHHLSIIIGLSLMIIALGTRDIYQYYAARNSSAQRARTQALIKALRGDINIPQAQSEQRAAQEARAQRRSEKNEEVDEEDKSELDRLLTSVIP